MPCVEVIRAQVGGRYGRRSIEKRETEGFTLLVSDVDRHYGGVWVARGCTAKTEEECAVLRHLGRACESHGCGGEE